MHVDRRAALWLVSAIAACHAEQQRRATTSAPQLDTREPVSVTPQGASSAPAAAASNTAVQPNPTADTADGGATVPDAAVPDAAAPDAAAPLPTTAELLRRCRALPATRRDCDDGAPRDRCRTVVQEFSVEAAARAVGCFEHIQGDCDGCAVRTCTQDALRGFVPRKLAACERVRQKVARASDAQYGDTMFDLCEEYASGMNARGVERFTRCLGESIGAGVRICLWDPYVTPCTERGGPLPPMDLGNPG